MIGCTASWFESSPSFARWPERSCAFAVMWADAGDRHDRAQATYLHGPGDEALAARDEMSELAAQGGTHDGGSGGRCGVPEPPRQPTRSEQEGEDDGRRDGEGQALVQDSDAEGVEKPRADRGGSCRSRPYLHGGW